MSQGDFNVTRLLDGSVRFVGPPVFVVSPAIAVQIARAILHEAGVEVVFADPGRTVIRPPAGNGHGTGIIR
jgi:hypothetical protein